MEKDIKILKNFCEVFRMSQKSIDKYDSDDYGEIIGQEEIQAIENLIARNKELEYKLREHISIESHEQVKQLYIPKSKVREKIEELIKEADYRTADNLKGRVHFQPEPVDFQIAVLQELLQEGDR